MKKTNDPMHDALLARAMESIEKLEENTAVEAAVEAERNVDMENEVTTNTITSEEAARIIIENTKQKWAAKKKAAQEKAQIARMNLAIGSKVAGILIKDTATTTKIKAKGIIGKLGQKMVDVSK